MFEWFIVKCLVVKKQIPLKADTENEGKAANV